eukprot:5522646-Pleurochrysis_carterae.AAC.1
MQNPWTGASTTLPGCFAWSDSLCEAPRLLSARGSAVKRCGSVACRRCEIETERLTLLRCLRRLVHLRC